MEYNRFQLPIIVQNDILCMKPEKKSEVSNISDCCFSLA